MINTKGWWDTLCKGCATTRKRGLKAMEWLGEEEADLKMEMQFEDGVCWMGLNTAMRIAICLPGTDFLKALQMKLRKGEYIIR